MPRTTVRDTRYRLERTAAAQQQLADRKPRRPLTTDQRQTVLAEVKRQQGNASEAARRLGLPPRTVREIRQRAAEQRVAGPRKSYTAQEKADLLAEVRETGESPTVVGRRRGVPGRTARGWARKEKMKEP